MEDFSIQPDSTCRPENYLPNSREMKVESSLSLVQDESLVRYE